MVIRHPGCQTESRVARLTRIALGPCPPWPAEIGVPAPAARDDPEWRHSWGGAFLGKRLEPVTELRLHNPESDIGERSNLAAWYPDVVVGAPHSLTEPARNSAATIGSGTAAGAPKAVRVGPPAGVDPPPNGSLARASDSAASSRADLQHPSTANRSHADGPAPGLTRSRTARTWNLHCRQET